MAISIEFDHDFKLIKLKYCIILFSFNLSVDLLIDLKYVIIMFI